MEGGISSMQTCFLVQAAPLGLYGYSGIDVPNGVGIIKVQVDSVLQGTAMAPVTQTVDVTRLISFGQIAGLYCRFFHKAGQVVGITIILLLTVVEVI